MPGDWIGWVCVVEAEDRPALFRMNTDLLGSRYGHVMPVDGNDPGIDIGLFCDTAIEVASFTSGNPDPLRTRQSAEVRAIYDRLREEGAELVAVMGDLNKGSTNDQPPQHPWAGGILNWCRVSGLVDAAAQITPGAPVRPPPPPDSIRAAGTARWPPSARHHPRPAGRLCGASPAG